MVDWCRDASFAPYGQLLTDCCLEQTIDDLIVQTPDSFPLKSYIPFRLKQSKFLDIQYKTSFYSPNFPLFFSQVQKLFPSVLSNRAYPVSLRMHSKSSQRKPAKHKKISRDKVSKRSALSQKNHWETKKRRCGMRKSATAQKSPYSFGYCLFV